MRLGLLMVPALLMACSRPIRPKREAASDLASKEDKVRVDAAEGLALDQSAAA